MTLRATALLGLFSLPFLGGCHECETFGNPAPHFKYCNISRLGQECAWFYADVQDTFFGVDYYRDMEAEFGGGPYR
jgi:hypothetical protein